jgi:LysM repeat protein
LPRDVKLPNRLDTLLDSLFIDHIDPFALYWEIAAQVHPEQLQSVQKRIRRALQQKGEINTESAILTACVLALTGFPAHRILQFLALYVRRGISLSQFEFAVSTIFVGSPPLPAELLYDVTQYTYLEKRLLARKSLEISDRLKDALTPELLLYLYLLSLRDDLSNENVQLIGLIMKNCFPSEDVRTRLGGAGLEEYGEIVRAWKEAEQRSFAVSLGSGPEGRAMRAFDRDSASFFLDKYFSDAALEKAPAEARRAPKPQTPPMASLVPDPREAAPEERPVFPAAPRRKRTESRLTVQRTADEASPAARARRAPARSAPAAAARAAVTPTRPASSVAAPSVESAPQPGAPRQRVRVHWRSLLPYAPVALAAIALAAVLVAMPPFRVPLTQPTAAQQPAAQAPIAQPPVVPSSPSAAAPSSDARPSEARPAATPYVVREGDSLWKIFRSLGRGQRGGRAWVDFLSATQDLNDLSDPDTIHPGKVLKIATPDH